jgi:hypothetical protein
MFSVTTETFTLLCVPDGLPDVYQGYRDHAHLVDEIDLHQSEGKSCFVAVGHGNDWPFLVVAQRYSPAGTGFWPGIALVASTQRLFVGAGERLLAYRLDRPTRLWEDRADFGFWRWHQHGRFMLMSAELELAAWDIEGRKCWSTFVEPPWEYRVEASVVHLDVMGRKSSFPLESGPER